MRTQLVPALVARCAASLVLLSVMSFAQGAYGAWRTGQNHNMAGFVTAPPANFNAVHMALIPKGPYRGWVLAWDYVASPVGPQLTQRWSIFNPSSIHLQPHGHQWCS